MWSQRIWTLLRRPARESHFKCTTVGAALSLSVAAFLELDRRINQHAEPDDGIPMTMSPPRQQKHQQNYSLNHLAGASCEGKSTLAAVHDLRKQSAERRALLRSRQTVRRMEELSVKECTLESRYDVDWKNPLGQGSFGVVFLGIDKRTQEPVAVKKISKRYTNEAELQMEMRALLHLRDSGGHPNICSLRENFVEGDYYYLILDLVSGGEMFDALVSQGAYSELDAARHIREAASALAFLHGVGVTHCDLKPENLMLSSENPSNAVVKLIDFGCAVVDEPDEDGEAEAEPSTLGLAGRTLAYCPPEMLMQSKQRLEKPKPSVDMWALGVILYSKCV